jgi:hypothetical protein
MTRAQHDEEHDSTTLEEQGLCRCDWCHEVVSEDEGGSNSDEATIPGTLGSGDWVCNGCRDGAS